MQNKRSDYSWYIKVIVVASIVALAPSISYAECTINGVIYPEEAEVSEYRCQNGEWIEIVERENTDTDMDMGTDMEDTDDARTDLIGAV